jgi:hypothetical protein
MNTKDMIQAAALAALVATPFSTVPAAGPFQIRRATMPSAVASAPPLATVVTAPYDGEAIGAGGASYYYGVYDGSGHAMDVSVQALVASHMLRIGFDDGNPTSAAVNAAQSSLTVAPASIRADGVQVATITIVPRDSGGVLLGRGLSIAIDSSMLWPAHQSGPLVDLGNGSYAATVTASVPGSGSVRVTVEGAVLSSVPTITATAVDPSSSLREVAIAELGGMTASGGPLATLAAGAGSGTPQATSVNVAIVSVNIAHWMLVNGDPSHDDVVLQTAIKAALWQLSLVQATPGALNPLDVRDAMDDLFGMSRELAQFHMDQAVAACGVCNGSGNPQTVCSGAASMASADAMRAAVTPDWNAIEDAYASAIRASVQSQSAC